MRKLITICLLITTTSIIKAQDIYKLKTYEENDKYGVLDENGNKITTAKYDLFTANFYEGLCSLAINGKIGFINNKGVEIIPFEFSDVHEFTNEGVAAVKKNNLWGFINKKGEEVIPFQFSTVNEFTDDGLATVEKNSKWGYVNKKGKEVIPIIYTKSFDFKKGKALVVNEKFVYNIDVNGEEIWPKYTLNNEYNEKEISVVINPKKQYGFLNKGVIYPNFYDEIHFSKIEFFNYGLPEKITEK